MIGLDQIKLLESRVIKAIEQIRLLREENKALKRTVDKSQARLQELEGLVTRFKSDQDEIEQGILRALKNLDKLEDEVGSRSRKEPAAHAAPAAPPVPAPEAERDDGPVVDPDEGDEEPASPSAEQLDIF